MDDQYLISVAKSEYRDGYNEGNAEKVLSVFGSGIVDMSEGQPSFFGTTARDSLRQRLEGLFSEYKVSLVPVIIEIVVSGGEAYDYGWHKLNLTPKSGGESMNLKLRYFERWQKQVDGRWTISFFINNKDVQPCMEPFPESEIVRNLGADCTK